MADTHGFELIIQTAKSVVVKALKGAWKSSDCPDQIDNTGRIPEFMDIPAGDDIGGFTIVDGQLQIPQEELNAEFATDVNGVELILGMNIQIEIGNPPVPSAQLLDFHTIVHAKAPIGTLPDSQDVGILLKDILRPNVWADLDQGHPLDDSIEELLNDYIHVAYENEEIPHVITESNIPFGPLDTMGATTQIFDDASNLARKILTSFPDPNTLEVSIPIYLRMYAFVPNTFNLDAPMGIETRIIIKVPFERLSDKYIAKFADVTSSDVSIGSITGAGADIAGNPNEATYYENNKTTLAGFAQDLDAQLSTELKNKGLQFANDLGNQEVDIPSKADIEEKVADIFFDELVSRDYLAIWSPSASNDEFAVDSVDVKVFSDSLNIALNNTGGADSNAITNFIPAGMEFSIAMSRDSLQEKIDESLVDSGFNNLPKRFEEDGKDVDLNTLNISIINNAVRLQGTVTVIDAVLGSIDVDASFTTDVGFHWTPDGVLNASGFQAMDHHMIGDPDVDVDEGIAFWIIAIILAIISFGVGGVLIGVITIIVILIVKAIVENIGSDSLVDGVTGAIDGITAWPPELSNIGRVKAVFFDPIDISTTGLVISGQMEIISSCESTQVVPATTAGKYTVEAAQNIQLKALQFYNKADFFWNTGDGGADQLFRDIDHSYDISGIYLAKHGVKVTEYGGAKSRHFATIRVKNVPPIVTMIPQITVNEGEVVTLEAHFEDIEYTDTHWSIWSFGDNHAPKKGFIEETHTKPKAIGTTTVQHAWCDNGIYHVGVQVIDNNGGVGTASMIVNVLNVAPIVKTQKKIYAYPCSPITLVSHFMDPGWCDTHTGTWRFGDCSETKMAVIKETHNAPAGKGTATASHTYKKCSTYYAENTIIDDDGAIGKAQTIVEVIDLKNAAFNDGFSFHRAGKIANFWAPFITSLKKSEIALRQNSTLSLKEAFFCEKCYVYDGLSSQKIKTVREAFIGIYQQLGANKDWTYQVEGLYMLQEQLGVAKLGIDPYGETDPSSPNIVWAEGITDKKWSHLLQRTCAKADLITVFLGVKALSEAEVDCCFDEIKLTAMQNIHCEALVTPPTEEKTCIDFKNVNPESVEPYQWSYKQVDFLAMGKEPHRLVQNLPPDQIQSLHLSQGIILEFDEPVSELVLSLRYYKSLYIKTVSQDVKGNLLAVDQQELTHPNTTFRISGNEIKRVQLLIRGEEAALAGLCFQKRNRSTNQTLVLTNKITENGRKQISEASIAYKNSKETTH
ncbi:PKD domain-containing protein [Flavivirga aquimarina]|uniref:PKD domain-containing protein n=1 Tax=Flavivirga aquimarina TaxID=2027862 RepID=A0ABT8WG46_9FLAO|nr:PKD domain-containing protein [Flavivirga aquimarina]MDO5972023.1 PKD domain-containing protein [Flavivirga aquimarina]